MGNELQITGQQLTLHEVKEMAEYVAKSRLFAVRTPEEAFCLMMLCQSEGIHPMQALKRFHIIDNKPAMRADAMQADFMSKGGSVEWVVSNNSKCHAVFTHPSAKRPFPVEITLQEFVDSGVAMTWKDGQKIMKDNWRKTPGAMLRARAISAGVRAVLPGVVAGIYTPEETQDFVEIAPPVPQGTTPTQPSGRVQRTQVVKPEPQPAPSAPVTVAASPEAPIEATFELVAPAPMDEEHSQDISTVSGGDALSLDAPPPAATIDIPEDFQQQVKLFGGWKLALHKVDPTRAAEWKKEMNAQCTPQARKATLARMHAELASKGII